MPPGAQRLALRLVARALQPSLAHESGALWAPSRTWLPAATGVRRYAAYPPHAVLNMPSLSPTMTQGNITRWRKQPGEQVAPGHILAEVETDKATIEWEAQEEGYMAKHLVPEGTRDIAIGTPVAVLAEEADGVPGLAGFAPGGSAGPSTTTPPSPAAPVPAAVAAAHAAAPKLAHLPAHQVLNMPALSPTMNRGNIVEWKKRVGDSVAPGDVYCEVETDKATISWESQEEGFVAKLLLAGGAKDVDVGTPALVLAEDKEAVAAFADYTGPASASAPPPPAPVAAAQRPEPAASVPAAPAKAPAATPARGASGRLHASPFARKLAAELGVDVQAIAGTGPGGRVVAADVRGAPKAAAGAPTPAAAVAAAAPGGAAPAAAAAPPGGHEDIPHSQVRRVVARRLLESKQTVPHYYLTMECQVSELLALREQMNALGAGGGGKADKAGGAAKLSINDFVVKAAAGALKAVPGVNASWHPDFVRQYSYVDVSIAVQTPGGLQVPIVRGADAKSIGAISSDIRALAAKAKAGKLVPADYEGGTFTVSNLGMYGIKQFAAIVNPPQAAILAVGATTQVVVKQGGVFREVPVMAATLSCDHRVVDGAMGAEWLAAFKSFIERPLTALL